MSKDSRWQIRHQSQPYRVIGDTLYCLGADSVLYRCLTLEEAERVLNDCHSSTYGGHMSEYATTQNILCYETHWIASLAIEAQKKRVKTHFDHTVHPCSFFEGDLVLLYNQANDKLGVGKFKPMWHGPYIVKRVLQKVAYELIDYEGNRLHKPRNGLYLKKYYAWISCTLICTYVCF